MVGSSNCRGTNVLGLRLAIGIVSALAFASPAIAETTTLVCPLDNATGSFTVDIDYAAGTIVIEQMEFGRRVNYYGPSAAIITDREIKFKLRDSSQQPGWLTTFEGSLDRLAGTLAVAITSFYNGHEEGSAWIQARCRAATQKF